MSDARPVAGPGSLRKSGLRNIGISMLVAGSSYLSLTLVARTFGGSVGSDAYFLLFSLTTVTAGLLSGVFATVFLPMFIEARELRGDPEAAALAGTLLMWTIAIVLPISVASFVFYNAFFALVTKYSPAQIEQIRPVLIYFSVVFALTVISEYYRTIALALGSFSLVAIGALFQPVFLIVATLFFSARIAEQALSVSLLTSRACLLVMMFAVTKRQWPRRMPLSLRASADTKRFLKIAAPYWSATFVTNLAVFYFDYVATGLGAGVLSAIAYAQRIFTLPASIILNPMLEIARTRFAQLRVRGDTPGFLRQHNLLVQFIAYFSIPVATFFFFFPVEIISSMFQRGAFGPQSVRISADCLQVLALSLPFSCLFMLNGRASESFQKLLWPSVFGTLGNLLVILATTLLVARLDYFGIPAARVLVDVCYFFPFGIIALRVFAGGLDTSHIARVVAIAALGSALPVLMYRWSGLAEAWASRFPSLPALAVLLAGFLSSYAISTALLDARVRAMAKRRLGL